MRYNPSFSVSQMPLGWCGALTTSCQTYTRAAQEIQTEQKQKQRFDGSSTQPTLQVPTAVRVKFFFIWYNFLRWRLKVVFSQSNSNKILRIHSKIIFILFSFIPLWEAMPVLCNMSWWNWLIWQHLPKRAWNAQREPPGHHKSQLHLTWKCLNTVFPHLKRLVEIKRGTQFATMKVSDSEVLLQNPTCRNSVCDARHH